MTVKIKSLAADRTREREGEWVAIVDLPGVELKVRSINYPAFDLAMKNEQQRLFRKYGRKPIPDEVSIALNGKLYAEHLLLDWRGFDETFSTDLAHELLTDVAYRDLVGHVLWASMQVGRVETEFVELAVGNSDGVAGTPSRKVSRPAG